MTILTTPRRESLPPVVLLQVFNTQKRPTILYMPSYENICGSLIVMFQAFDHAEVAVVSFG